LDKEKQEILYEAVFQKEDKYISFTDSLDISTLSKPFKYDLGMVHNANQATRNFTGIFYDKVEIKNKDSSPGSNILILYSNPPAEESEKYSRENKA